MATAGDGSLPLYREVAAELRREIADGAIKPGGRLPPARDMAAVRGVNHNTMFRALRLLRDEGLLEFKRGRGVTVAGSPERSALISKTKELVAYARNHGYRYDELISIIETLR